MDLGIKNKTAIVQAASKGLGYSVAHALSAEGVKVVICARTASELNNAAAQIHESTSNPVLPVQCDVSRHQQLQTLFRQCRKEFGDPDILVCNAGGPPRGQFNDFTKDDWNQAFQTNFHSAVASVNQVVETMKTNGWGRLIFIASMAVKQPIDSLVLSNAARSALTAYAKTIANDLAPHGITVNCLLPGPHRTSRLEHLVNDIMEDESCSMEEAWEKLGTSTPLGRLGSPEELGALAAFICSTQAGFITGQSIVHDGGTIKGLF